MAADGRGLETTGSAGAANDVAEALGVYDRLAVRECNTYAWSKRAGLLAAADQGLPLAGQAAPVADPDGMTRRSANLALLQVDCNTF